MKFHKTVIWMMVAMMVLALGGMARADCGGCHGKDLLADGKLDAWQTGSGAAPGKGCTLKDGVMTLDGCGYVWTKERFDNFILKLEFKAEGNSGVFIRTDNLKSVVQTGIEMQVLEPVDTPNRHSCGAIYDLVAPSKEMCKADDWNALVLKVDDNEITVTLNGEQVVEMDLDQWTTAGKNPDGSGNKFKTALKDFVRDGHIGLQDHGHLVSFRKISVKSIK